MYFHNWKYENSFLNVLLQSQKYQKLFWNLPCFILVSNKELDFLNHKNSLRSSLKQFVILNRNLRSIDTQNSHKEEKEKRSLMIYSTYGGSGVKHCLSGDDKQYNDT